MIPQVRPTALDGWLREHAGQDPLVLDVREAIEFQFARVSGPGFELLHIPMHEIPGRLAELDPDRPIACLCHHGMRSQNVAMYLVRQGFAEVANIAGGIDAWSAERDPAVPRY